MGVYNTMEITVHRIFFHQIYGLGYPWGTFQKVLIGYCVYSKQIIVKYLGVLNTIVLFFLFPRLDFRKPHKHFIHVYCSVFFT